MEFRQAYDPARALSAGWALLQKAPILLLVGGILLVVSEDPEIKWQSRGPWRDSDRWLSIWSGLACALGIGVWLFNCLLQVGFGNVVREIHENGHADWEELFRPRGRWFKMVFGTLFQRTVQLVAALPLLVLVGTPIGVARMVDLAWLGTGVGVFLGLLYLPVAVYVMLGVSLVVPAVALEGLDPVEALRRSWALTDGRRLPLLGYWIVTWLAGISGLLLCCVGVFGTTVWARTAWFESYVRLIGSESGAASEEPSSSGSDSGTPLG